MSGASPGEGEKMCVRSSESFWQQRQSSNESLSLPPSLTHSLAPSSSSPSLYLLKSLFHSPKTDAHSLAHSLRNNYALWFIKPSFVTWPNTSNIQHIFSHATKCLQGRKRPTEPKFLFLILSPFFVSRWILFSLLHLFGWRFGLPTKCLFVSKWKSRVGNSHHSRLINKFTV